MFKIFVAENNHKYEIHSNGKIYSSKRISNGCCNGVIKRKELSKQTSKNGYEFLKIGKKTYQVHRLVAECFLGESDLHVNHIDGNKTNNCVENLEYVTRSENMIHSHEILRQKLPLKLSSEDRTVIIKRYNNGETMKAIAEDYDVSYSTIRRTISGAEYISKTTNCTYSSSNKKRKSGSERIPKEIKEKVLILRKRGKSYGKIATELGVSKYSVAKLCGWKRSLVQTNSKQS